MSDDIDKNRILPNQASCSYLSQVRDFLALYRQEALASKAVFPGVGRIRVGLLAAYTLFGVPLFIVQHNPNFKIKIFLRSVPLVSLARKSPAVNPVPADSSRAPRIYLSIGSLPFFDNNSGIPRVAKELTREGLLAKDSRLVPVYPDPATGKYRIAVNWCRQRHYPDIAVDGLAALKDDPEITVAPGDWLIHTMINANELDFMDAALSDFRAKGGKVGAILHDIIAVDNPEYFKKRDARLFARWLHRVQHCDRIFAISHATKNAYERYLAREKTAGAPCAVFHLGADFRGEAAAVQEAVPEAIAARPFYLVVSTIEPRKGHGDTLSAFECLWKEGRDVNLVFVGRKGWKVSRLCRRIKRYPEFGQRFFWLTGVRDSLLRSLYQNCAAVIVPSRAEGFGLSLVEPLQLGRPVIARDIPVFREIAGDAVQYFDAGVSGALAVAVRDFACGNRKAPQTDAPHFLRWKDSFQEFLHCVV